MGALDDEFSHLLGAAWQYRRQSEQSGAASQNELEAALTEFRRAAAAW
jgi:hypothetical protein